MLRVSLEARGSFLSMELQMITSQLKKEPKKKKLTT